MPPRKKATKKAAKSGVIKATKADKKATMTTQTTANGGIRRVTRAQTAAVAAQTQTTAPTVNYSPDWTLGTRTSVAETNHQKVCTFGPKGQTKQDAQLIGLLQVYPDPNTPSREAYDASFFIRHSDPSTPDDFVATIDSWRISRTDPTWIPTFLVPDPANAEDTERHETSLCLRALYIQLGTVRFSVRSLRTELGGSHVVFVELVYVDENFQGQGLLPQILSCYRDLLRALPAPFALTSANAVVLLPSRPDGAAGQA